MDPLVVEEHLTHQTEVAARVRQMIRQLVEFAQIVARFLRRRLDALLVALEDEWLRRNVAQSGGLPISWLQPFHGDVAVFKWLRL